ncbi:MAG: hypothetical protein ACRDTC_02280 [Pseudonocardiaceae bacterium]
MEVAATGFRARLNAIKAREKSSHLSEAEFTAICAGVEDLLHRAEQAASGQCPRHYPFLSWWRGTNIEAAFQNIHRAEAEIVRLYSDDEVDAEIPEAVARAEIGLNRDHPMREVARALSRMKAGSAKRTVLSKVIQMGHESADRSHSRIHNFRNVLLSTALLIAVLMLIFSWVVYRTPGSVPLCFEPAAAPTPVVSTPVAPTTVACPTGDGPGRAPAPFDVVVVAMLGLLGGSLAAAVSIRNLRGTSTPYDIPIALALLKVPAGAITALGALIAIRGEFIPGLSALDSQEQILAYALIFGYAQQLLTGLIDRRAHDLLDTVPSKDPEQSAPPQRPLPPITPPATPAPLTPDP